MTASKHGYLIENDCAAGVELTVAHWEVIPFIRLLEEAWRCGGPASRFQLP